MENKGLRAKVEAWLDWGSCFLWAVQHFSKFIDLLGIQSAEGLRRLL